MAKVLDIYTESEDENFSIEYRSTKKQMKQTSSQTGSAKRRGVKAAEEDAAWISIKKIVVTFLDQIVCHSILFFLIIQSFL